MRKKIALVNQRYGLEVNGGSELYTRQIAEKLTEFFDVDVITTKALDYTTWANHYPNDEENINGVHVRRFPVDCCRASDFEEYNGQYLFDISQGNFNEEKERIWFEKQGPKSSKAIDYIRNHSGDYDVIIFVTYLYYLTVMGIPKVADKAIMIPTAHDEPFIHYLTYKKLFSMPRGFIFLTDEEKALVNRLFGTEHIPSIVAGAGVDIPSQVSGDAFKEKYGIDNYIVYVGRIDEGKECPLLFKYFLEYKKRNYSDLKLVLMGKAVCEIPDDPDIISLGFVSDEDKFNGIKGSSALILPSKYESLSISVLESMALGIPVIVNGQCEVLKGHCIKSNGGLYYTDYFEFEGCINYLFSHSKEYSQMQQNCFDYIERKYRWDVIIAHICRMIEEI